MTTIPSEDYIHQIYQNMQNQREQDVARMRKAVLSEDPGGHLSGRQAFHASASRFTSPSFRSEFFNVGEGLQVVDSGATVVLAMKTVPGQHSGVLTGFSQYFGGCDGSNEDAIQNSITWAIRINGFPTQGFMDFVGEFSTLLFPNQVYFPLTGGASTLSKTSTSVGGSAPDSLPTVTLSATNNWKTSVVLQGRLVGYTFPLAERNDEFSNI